MPRDEPERAASNRSAAASCPAASWPATSWPATSWPATSWGRGATLGQRERGDGLVLDRAGAGRGNGVGARRGPGRASSSSYPRRQRQSARGRRAARAPGGGRSAACSRQRPRQRRVRARLQHRSQPGAGPVPVAAQPGLPPRTRGDPGPAGGARVARRPLDARLPRAQPPTQATSVAHAGRCSRHGPPWSKCSGSTGWHRSCCAATGSTTTKARFPTAPYGFRSSAAHA